MKLEALQSLSVGVMIVGFVLSALGGFGAIFFKGGSERPGLVQHSARSQSTEPDHDLPKFDGGADAGPRSLPRSADDITAEQLLITPDPILLPFAARPPAREAAAVTEPATQPVQRDPAPAVANAEVWNIATLPPVAEEFSQPAAPAQPSGKTAPSKKEFESKVAAIEIPDEMLPPPPVGEKLAPLPATKIAKLEAAPVIAGAAPEKPELGIEPRQREKLLQRLGSIQNGSLAIQVAQDNAEAMSFATALKETFVAAGWKVTGVSEVKANREQTGLTLSSGTFPPPAEVTTIFSALVSAGIKLGTDLDPSQGKKPPVLFVGSRP